MLKKMTSTSQKCVNHTLARRNTQQISAVVNLVHWHVFEWLAKFDAAFVENNFLQFFVFLTYYGNNWWSHLGYPPWIYSNPLVSKGSREVATFIMKKHPSSRGMIFQRFMTLSVRNFDLNYINSLKAYLKVLISH